MSQYFDTDYKLLLERNSESAAGHGISGEMETENESQLYDAVKLTEVAKQLTDIRGKL